MAAPTALLAMAHHAGELPVAAACAASNNIMCLSTTASCSLEAVAAAAPSSIRYNPTSSQTFRVFGKLFLQPGEQQQSVTTLQAARGWARPPCRHFKTQSCCCLGSAFEVAQTLANLTGWHGLGVSSVDYTGVLQRAGVSANAYAATAGALSVVAGRLSYTYGGPQVTRVKRVLAGVGLFQVVSALCVQRPRAHTAVGAARGGGRVRRHGYITQHPTSEYRILAASRKTLITVDFALAGAGYGLRQCRTNLVHAQLRSQQLWFH
jgi:hypothetical protein